MVFSINPLALIESLMSGEQFKKHIVWQYNQGASELEIIWSMECHKKLRHP
jgi:hypothetical protein